MFSGRGNGKRGSSTGNLPLTRPAEPVRRPEEESDNAAQEEPPAYTAGPSTGSHQSVPHSAIAGYPSIDYSRYLPPYSEISKDRTTVTVTLPSSSFNADTIIKMIRIEAALPPMPLVCIRGMSGDFKVDVKLNVLPLIWRSRSVGAWNYLRLVADGEIEYRGGEAPSVSPSVRGDLSVWVRKFCHDPSVQRRSVPQYKPLSRCPCAIGKALRS